jgi:predicted nucleotidyltransferase
MDSRIRLNRSQLARFCRRHHIRRLAVFGSAIHGDLRPESDVDMLVEFEPGRKPGLAFFGLEEELSAMIGRRVDLNTAGFLSRYFRDEIAREAEELYAEAG